MVKETAVSEKIKKDILRILGKYLDFKQYKVFIFGSRVTGKGTKRSDIDIGIDGPTAVPGQTIAKIKDDLEQLPTLYTIEVVDFKNAAPDFKKVALQDIELFTK